MMSKPRTETVYLWDGDDQAEIDRLEAAVDEAVGIHAMSQTNPKRIAPDAEEPETLAAAKAAAKAYDDFAEEAKARALKVVLRPIGRSRWRDVSAKHPPREGNDRDAALGFNEQTLGDDLLPYVDPDDASIRTIVEPEFADSKARTAFMDDLEQHEFERIYSRAVRLNTEQRPDPKADMSSRLDRIFAETSQ